MWWLWRQERNRIREGEIPMQIPHLAHRVVCTAAEFVPCFANDSDQSRSNEGKLEATTRRHYKDQYRWSFCGGTIVWSMGDHLTVPKKLVMANIFFLAWFVANYLTANGSLDVSFTNSCQKFDNL
jgi:hypothetical protein